MKDTVNRASGTQHIDIHRVDGWARLANIIINIIMMARVQHRPTSSQPDKQHNEHNTQRNTPDKTGNGRKKPNWLDGARNNAQLNIIHQLTAAAAKDEQTKETLNGEEAKSIIGLHHPQASAQSREKGTGNQEHELLVDGRVGHEHACAHGGDIHL